MSSSPAEQNEQQQPKKITFRFCRECSNMLYPKEDKDQNTLDFACRTCTYSEPAATSCVFRNELSNTVGETAGITQDVGQDPTVGLHSSLPDFCTLCGQEIFCEICGQETDRGCWLEVDDADAANTGLMTPTSMTASTPIEMHTSQQLEQLHIEQERQNQPPDSQKKEEDLHSHNTQS